MSIQRLDFDPARCVDDRPWRITPAQLKSPCAIHRKEEDKLSGDYRSMVKRVLQEFPQVKLWDSSLELCDGEYCRAMIDGVLLYRDADHLSEAGSLFMGARLPLQDMRKNQGDEEF